MVRILGPVVDRWTRKSLGSSGPFPCNSMFLLFQITGRKPPTIPMWKGWHSRRGIFLAGGPDIDHRAEPVRVQYGDVVPTMLDLLTIQTPIDLKGMSVVRHPAGSRE